MLHDLLTIAVNGNVKGLNTFASNCKRCIVTSHNRPNFGRKFDYDLSGTFLIWTLMFRAIPIQPWLVCYRIQWENSGCLKTFGHHCRNNVIYKCSFHHWTVMYISVSALAIPMVLVVLRRNWVWIHHSKKLHFRQLIVAKRWVTYKYEKINFWNFENVYSIWATCV